MRRTLIIAAAAIVTLGIGVAVYFYFFTGSAGISVVPEGSSRLPVAGQGTIPSQPGTTSAGSPPQPVAVSARLVKISAGPIVPGIAVVNVPATGTSSSSGVSVSYIERQSGNVFSYAARAGTLTRTNNQTVPGIASALWLPDASRAFVRYLSGDDFSTINSYVLPAHSSTSTAEGYFLPQNLADIAVSSAGVLMLASGINGSIASFERPDGGRTTELFTTPLSALRVSFAGKNRYLAYTKPSAALPGTAFMVDANGNFSRIIGPRDGLVALASPSGKWIAASYTIDGAMHMELVNTSTSETLPLPVATIADKCVWAADDSALYCGIPMNPPNDFAYPDDWYQGAVSFSDRLWKIDVAGRFAQLVLDFSKETSTSLDADALAIDPLATELVFVNKADGSLWGYQL